MSYTDLRDFEAEYRLVVSDFETNSMVYCIELEKLGGGRYGVPYRGNWRAIITRNGEPFFKSQDYITNIPTTHRDTAIQLIEYLTDDIGAYDCSYPIEEGYMGEDGDWVTITE